MKLYRVSITNPIYLCEKQDPQGLEEFNQETNNW